MASAAPARTIRLSSGLRLSLVDQGVRSTSAVVFVPGPTDSWRSYASLLQHVPADVRVIAVSQRGHGDSDKPDDGYAIENFASDLSEVLKACGVEQAVLVGHSGSCPVVRRVALDNPSRVAGLVLEASPTTLADDVAFGAFLDTVVAELTDPIDDEFASGFVAGTSGGRTLQCDARELAEEVRKVPVSVWKQMFTALGRYDDTAEVANIEVPVLLIWGDADDLVPVEMQRALLGALPQARLIVYPGVGHTPRWEQPQRFARDVIAFAVDVI